MKIDRKSRHLKTALAAVVVFQIGLYMICLLNGHAFSNSADWQSWAYLASLIALSCIAYLHTVNQTHVSSRDEAAQEQLEAILSMLGTVKHKLNNDMQVVLGNAELAEILISAGGDVAKPVNNITYAANDAIERIEQLTVICSAPGSTPKPIDLNASLRESMARLIADIPPIVNLRLELNPLSSRAIVDRRLLSLSLSHLIQQISHNMHHGGEIVVRTQEKGGLQSGDHHFIFAEIHLVNGAERMKGKAFNAGDGLIGSEKPSGYYNALQASMNTSKAIVELSGALNVRLFSNSDEALFAIRLATSAQHTRPDAVSAELRASQSLS